MLVETKIANYSGSDVEASKTKTRQLRPNPFTTYRDPDTGRWMVIKTAVA